MIDKIINKALLKLECIRDEAGNLRRELDNNSLEVVLDGREGDRNRARCVESRNPEWYSLLFQANYNGVKKGEKVRSLFRRYEVIARLEKLEKGVYYDRRIYRLLMDEIRDRIFNGYYVEEFRAHVPPQLDESKFIASIRVL
jgi:hypothetical protein